MADKKQLIVGSSAGIALVTLVILNLVLYEPGAESKLAPAGAPKAVSEGAKVTSVAPEAIAPEEDYPEGDPLEDEFPGDEDPEGYVDEQPDLSPEDGAEGGAIPAEEPKKEAPPAPPPERVQAPSGEKSRPEEPKASPPEEPKDAPTQPERAVAGEKSEVEAETEVTFEVVELVQADLAAECSSSDKPVKLKGSAKIRYDASAVLDGDLATAWAEGKKGDGIGEWVEIRLAEPRRLDHLALWNGYQKVKKDRLGDRFMINQRVKEVEIDCGTGKTFQVTLEDKRERQVIELDGELTNRVRLTIRSVYPAKYPDATISEVRMFERREAISEELAHRTIEDWIATQNRGDFAAYAEFYEASFRGVKRAGKRRTTFDQERWLDDRKKMFERPMTVRAEGYRFRRAGDELAVTFVQHWSSGNFADRGDKEIHMRARDGALRFTYEEMLFSEIVKK